MTQKALAIPTMRGPSELPVWLRNHPHTLPDNLANTAFGQLGSRGSGNHFLEVCLDESDSVWLVLHSGSRGVGNKLADRHIKLGAKCPGARPRRT